MNMKQVWAGVGGFFLAYLAITLTNKPAVTPQDVSGHSGGGQAVVAESGQPAPGDQGQAGAALQAAQGYQKGFCFPAVGADALGMEDSDSALTAISATGAQWIAITPVLFQDTASANQVQHDAAQSPSVESLEHAIEKCRALGLKVMLKPLVSARDGSRRENFAPFDPAAWSASYLEAVRPYLELAQAQGVEVVCLGSSYSRTEAVVPWPEMIRQVRSVYSGALTYGASHRANGSGGYQAVPFWGDLDYIGIEAFFPLTTHAVPTETDLQEGWQRTATEIEGWLGTLAVKKPVLFTSLGYASVVGAAVEPDRPPVGAQDDPELQATAYEAFFSQVYRRPWLAGSYWYGWTNPALAGAAGDANPYAIEGKPALEVVRAHYAGAR